MLSQSRLKSGFLQLKKLKPNALVMKINPAIQKHNHLKKYPLIFFFGDPKRKI
jgi:hypothetical protein